MYSFPSLEPVCSSKSGSNCCFLTCIQGSLEPGQVVWYSHVFQNFPQLIVIHKGKSFDIVNKAEVDVFLELSCFIKDQTDVGNLTSASSAFVTGQLSQLYMTTRKTIILYCIKLMKESKIYICCCANKDVKKNKINKSLVISLANCVFFCLSY